MYNKLTDKYYLMSITHEKNIINLQNTYLIKVDGKLDSDKIDLKLFNPKENSIINKQINIFRKLTSTELKYINIEADLYMLIHSEKIHFLQINVDEETLREIQIRDDIGKNPSLCNVNNKTIIFIGGNNSENVFIFDILSNKFELVGKMNSVRFGAYIIYDNDVVYICGGVNQHNDNTLEVEYFYLSKHLELKTAKFENSYLLRKINPLCFEIDSGEMFLVCGGYCLFDKTDTSCFVEADKQNVQISNILLPKAFSSLNPNTLSYKGIFYFFGEEENEIYKFSSSNKSFTMIMKEDLIID